MSNTWFDELHYARQKVQQMNDMNYEPDWLATRGADKWNLDLYATYLSEYRTEEGMAVTAYENFLACNGANYPEGIDPIELNISGNPLFDVDYYLASVVAWANASARDGNPWTAKTMSAHILEDLHLSLWEHFKTIGLEAQLNPSANFDTHAYLTARVKSMNSDMSGGPFTMADAIAALKTSGDNPIMDFCEYGAARHIQAVAVGHSVPVAPPAQPSAGEAGGSLGGASSTNTPQNPVAPADPNTPDTPEGPEPGPGEGNPSAPDTPGPATPDEPAIPDEPPPDMPVTGGETEPAPTITIDIATSGDFRQDAVRSNGHDIYADYDVGGKLTAPLFDARGENDQSGNIQLTVQSGELAYNSPVVLYGQDIDVDIYGSDGLPKLEIWAAGTCQVVGGEITRTPTVNGAGHITGYAGINDWVALRSVGAGESTIELGNGHDIFELFDTSATCSPATLPRGADLRIDLGVCADYLEIGNLAVAGGATQRINVDLGADWNRDQITIGRVTEGKLILHLDNFEIGRSKYYDQEYVTSRNNIKPQTFADTDSAASALAKFGIGIDGETTLNSWIDGTFEKGATTYANAAIAANGMEYVIYDNILLELSTIFHDEGA